MIQLSEETAQTWWLLLESRESSIPTPFLVILVSWLAIIFMSLGLFSPANGTVLAVLFVCALSVSGAIFLVLEMDQPLSGLIRLSEGPMRDAARRLGP